MDVLKYMIAYICASSLLATKTQQGGGQNTKVG